MQKKYKEPDSYSRFILMNLANKPSFSRLQLLQYGLPYYVITSLIKSGWLSPVDHPVKQQYKVSYDFGKKK